MATYTVTIDHTRVAADLTDFPVYVNLADMPAGFWLNVTNGGGDIRCFAGATPLAREVVSCNTGTQQGELHIKAALADSTHTVLTVAVDGASSEPAANSTYGSQAVWSNGYNMVHHMSEDPGATTPQDSTANNYDGTYVEVWGSGNQIDGKIGKGFASNFNNHYTVNPAANVTGVGARTTSIWCNANSVGNQAMWGFGTQSGGELWEMVGFGETLIWHGYGGGYDTVSISAPLPAGQWNHAVLTYDGSALAVYTNGVYRGSYTVVINTTSSFNNVGGPAYFPRWSGALDEARLSTVARSAGWIATEYANQNDPATFYTTAFVAPPAEMYGVSSITGLTSITL